MSLCSNCTLALNYAPVNVKLEEGGGCGGNFDYRQVPPVRTCYVFDPGTDFFNAVIVSIFFFQSSGYWGSTVSQLMIDSPFKWPCFALKTRGKYDAL